MVKINGHNLHVEINGQQGQPPVILLHHGLGTTMSWTRQVPDLDSAGYRTIVYDRWGYGRSDPRQHFSMPNFKEDLDDLRALIITLGLDCVSLVGHSDGGTIALYYAAQYPAMVASVVTIAAHIYLEEKMEPGIMSIRDEYISNTIFREGLVRVHGDKAEQVFFNWFNGWHNPEIIAWDMRKVISGVQCKTLVIQGAQDEHATPGHARDIAAAIVGAELWLVPGADHMLPQNHTDVFNPRLIGFLDNARI